MNRLDEYDLMILKQEQSAFVVHRLMVNGMNRSDALKLWYNSKTKYEIQDSGNIKFELVAGMRCYEELILEIKKDPHWMHGMFWEY